VRGGWTLVVRAVGETVAGIEERTMVSCKIGFFAPD